MPEIARLDPRTSAVLTLDCQKGIVDFVAGSETATGPLGPYKPGPFVSYADY